MLQLPLPLLLERLPLLLSRFPRNGQLELVVSVLERSFFRIVCSLHVSVIGLGQTPTQHPPVCQRSAETECVSALIWCTPVAFVVFASSGPCSPRSNSFKTGACNLASIRHLLSMYPLQVRFFLSLVKMFAHLQTNITQSRVSTHFSCTACSTDTA